MASKHNSCRRIVNIFSASVDREAEAEADANADAEAEAKSWSDSENVFTGTFESL